MALHVVSFIFELGVVACTLINLLAGGDPSTTSSSDRNSEIAMTAASILTTCATFVVTMIGPGRVIATARRTLHRASNVGGKKVNRTFMSIVKRTEEEEAEIEVGVASD